MTERDNLLNDIFFNVDIQEHLAKKYGKTPSYISQLAKWLKQLKQHPETKDNKLICSNCEKSNTNLIFYHNHNTNQLISLICRSCYLKLKNENLDKGISSIEKEKQPIEYLKFLNEFFKENVEYLMKNKKITNFILENENKFNEIENILEEE